MGDMLSLVQRSKKVRYYKVIFNLRATFVQQSVVSSQYISAWVMEHRVNTKSFALGQYSIFS